LKRYDDDDDDYWLNFINFWNDVHVVETCKE